MQFPGKNDEMATAENFFCNKKVGGDSCNSDAEAGASS